MKTDWNKYYSEVIADIEKDIKIAARKKDWNKVNSLRAEKKRISKLIIKEETMRVLIMKCESDLWYRNKIGKLFDVQAIDDKYFKTKEGLIRKDDVEIIDK